MKKLIYAICIITISVVTFLNLQNLRNIDSSNNFTLQSLVKSASADAESSGNAPSKAVCWENYFDGPLWSSTRLCVWYSDPVKCAGRMWGTIPAGQGKECSTD